MSEASQVVLQDELDAIEKHEKIGAGACANIYRKGNAAYKILKENIIQM